mmetsp:Transcript_13975/g.20396  ORF Transcript_13975/g.20396 Transcript_13975/m.20396 type:complete len:259 (-) Transcript_13975:275-1051(-)
MTLVVRGIHHTGGIATLLPLLRMHVRLLRGIAIGRRRIIIRTHILHASTLTHVRISIGHIMLIRHNILHRSIHLLRCRQSLLLGRLFLRLDLGIVLLSPLSNGHLVLFSLPCLALNVGVSLFLWCITPHFSKDARYLCVAHAWVFVFYDSALFLAEVEKGGHGPLRCRGVFFGAFPGHLPGACVGGFLGHVALFVFCCCVVPVGAFFGWEVSPHFCGAFGHFCYSGGLSELIFYFLLLCHKEANVTRLEPFGCLRRLA